MEYKPKIVKINKIFHKIHSNAELVVTDLRTFLDFADPAKLPFP
jgi:hypothetical protein